MGNEGGCRMNCLKSIHIVRDCGTIRLAIISFFLMVTFFTLFYVAFKNIYPNLHLDPINPALLPVLILIYPVHKLLHGLPVWLSGYHCHLSVQWKTSKYPLLFCDLTSRLPRNLAICVVVFPGMVLTILGIIIAALAPQFLPYIAVVAAINIGLSATDWIYAGLLLRMPPHTYVEDSRDGFHILIQTIQKDA